MRLRQERAQFLHKIRGLEQQEKQRREVPAAGSRGDATVSPRGAEGTGEVGTTLIPPCFLPGCCQRAEQDESSLRSMEKQVRPGKSLEVISPLRGVLVMGMPPGLYQRSQRDPIPISCPADPGAGGAAGSAGRGEGEAGQGGGGSAEPPVLHGGECGQDTPGRECPGPGTAGSPPPCTPRTRRRTPATTSRRCRTRRETRWSSQVGPGSSR